MAPLAEIARYRLSVLTEPLVRRNRDGQVVISGFADDQVVFCTTDGSEPNLSSKQYSKPFLKVDDGTIKAMVYEKGLGQSRTNVTNFNQLTVTAPSIHPGNVFFYQSVSVRLVCETSDADIYYTLDGSEPNQSSMRYRQPINIAQNTTIRARAFKAGYRSSTMNSAIYKSFNPEQGLIYRYYQGKWRFTPDFIRLFPDRTGSVSKISYAEIETNKDHYALQFLGIIDIITAGEYTFYTGSNDGSRLFINNVQVVYNDGPHGFLEESGKINLSAGKHMIEVRYFQNGGGQDLLVSFKGPGIPKQEIPAHLFYRDK